MLLELRIIVFLTLNKIIVIISRNYQYYSSVRVWIPVLKSEWNLGRLNSLSIDFLDGSHVQMSGDRCI